MSHPEKLVKFRCPCGQKLSVAEEFAGKKGRCPKCGTKFRIPTLDEIIFKKQGKQPLAPAPAPVEPPLQKPLDSTHEKIKGPSVLASKPEPPPPPAPEPPLVSPSVLASQSEAERPDKPAVEDKPIGKPDALSETPPTPFPASVPAVSAPAEAGPPAPAPIRLKNSQGNPVCPLCLESTDPEDTECPYCFSDFTGQEAQIVAGVLIKPGRGGRTPFQQAIDSPSTRVCPQCAEMIHSMARKCKFCKRSLIGEKTGEMIKVAPPEIAVGRPRDLVKCLIFFAITLTFYGYWWLYEIGKDLRTHGGGSFKAGLHAFLTFVTMGLWGVYVMHHYGKELDAIRSKEKLEPMSWFGVVLIVLWVFGLGGFIGMLTRVLSAGFGAFQSVWSFMFLGFDGLFILACLLILQVILNDHWKQHRSGRLAQISQDSQ